MSPLRRLALQRLAGLAGMGCAPPSALAAARLAEGSLGGGTIRRGAPLVFPRDHGAHPASRTEWWYATGWLGGSAAPPATPTHGFQVTFFRSRTGLASDNPSRFAARQLLFAHAALTWLGGGGAAAAHVHDQRIVRWSGAENAAGGAARIARGDVRIGEWSLRDIGPAWQVRIVARDFELDLTLARTQPLLLQGDAGYSRKGPQEQQASHYYSEPQLAARARIALMGHAAAGSGRAWLDHEWSDEILAADAVGWDWIGINLLDGSALTAFQLRRRDGTALWAGGSYRADPAASAASVATDFAVDAVRFSAGRRWRSPASGTSYPVQWRIETPAGAFEVRALLDAQELDSRASTGTIYWEGLSELLDAAGRRVGLGYLEMTGYAAALPRGF